MNNERDVVAKIDNIFIMYLSAIITKKAINIKHKVNEDVYNKLLSRIKELNENNLTQMYDELNVKSTEIIKTINEEDKTIIEAKLTARYMDYRINSSTLKYVNGNNKSRDEVVYYITLEKSKDATDENLIKVCPGCGASIDVNRTGECEYCHAIYNTKDYDWVVTCIRN